MLIASNVLNNEIKYFISNSSFAIAIEKLLQIAFSRHHIERLFEDAKGRVGFDHFEARRYLVFGSKFVSLILYIAYIMRVK